MTDLRRLLRFLGMLAEQELKLPKKELAKARGDALAVAVEGWKFLAGELPDRAETDVCDRVVAKINELMPYRKQERGRKEGQRTEHSVELDRAINAAVEAGASLRGATKQASERQQETHRRRIQRGRAAERRKIADETQEG